MSCSWLRSHSFSLLPAFFFFSLPASCRCGLWLQGSAAAAGHISGVRDQVRLYRKDQRPPGRGDGYLQRCCESEKETVTPKLLSLGATVRFLLFCSLCKGHYIARRITFKGQ